MNATPEGIFIPSEDLKAAPATVKLWVIALMFGHPTDNIPGPEAITPAKVEEPSEIVAVSTEEITAAAPVDDNSDDLPVAADPANPTDEEKAAIQAKKRSNRAVKAAATRKANKEAAEAAAAAETPPVEEVVVEVAETPPAAPEEPEPAAEEDLFGLVAAETTPPAVAGQHPIDALADADLPHMTDIVKGVQSYMAANGKEGVVAALASLGKKKISECTKPAEIRQLVKELSLNVI